LNNFAFPPVGEMYSKIIMCMDGPKIIFGLGLT